MSDTLLDLGPRPAASLHAAVVYVEAAITALQNVPGLQAQLWAEHLAEDLKTLKLLAAAEQGGLA